MNYEQYLDIAGSLGAAWIAGALIGLERNYSGRPAGLRTHALVSTASALLMIVSYYQWDWLGTIPKDTVRTDPTRVVQGIMTGIGFLGAGVIFKDGLTVRGLTTAASIWMTASVGILYGIGFFFPAVLATIMTLLTLTAVRYLEPALPSQHYAELILRYKSDVVPEESEIRNLVKDHKFHVLDLSYRLDGETDLYEYRMTLRSKHAHALAKFAKSLRSAPGIFDHRLSPKGD